MAVWGEGEFLDIPWDVGGERGELARGEIEAAEAEEVAAFVAGEEERLAVRGELGAVAGDGSGGAVGERFDFAGGDVDEPEVGFVGGDGFGDGEGSAVVGPIGDAPAAAFEFGEELLLIRVVRVHDPEVGVGAVASGGGEGEA